VSRAAPATATDLPQIPIFQNSCGTGRPLSHLSDHRGLDLKCLGELNPLSKHDDYLDNAAQTLNLANHVSKLAQRFHLLDLAEKWVELADRSHRQAEHSAVPLEEHPLFMRAFRQVSADTQ